MTNREQFRLYMKTATDTSGKLGDSHLNETQMFAFCRGAISAAEREAAEAHLVDCEQCIALFRSARDFLEPAREDAIDKGEINLAWQSTWSRVHAESDPAITPEIAGADRRQPGSKAGFKWLTPWWRPALAFVLVALIAGGLIYLFSEPPSKPPEKAQQELPAATPAPDTAQRETPAAPNAPSQSSPTASEDVLATNITARPGTGFEDSATRGEREDAARASLVTARKVFLDVNGHEPAKSLLRSRLGERVPAGGRFLLTAGRDEAEVALKIEAEAPRADATIVSFTARVVGPDGKTLWPTVPGVIARRYQGPAKKAADRLLNDLLDDIRRVERKRR